MNVPIHCCFDAGMTQQFLQHLRLHTAFDCSCSIGMSQGVHTKVFDPCFIAQFVKVGIIGTVLCRFSCSPVDKNKITHDKPRRNARALVYVIKCLVQRRGLLLLRTAVPNTFEDFISPTRQRYCTVAVLRFRRTRTPKVLLVALLQGFVDRQRPIPHSLPFRFLPIDCILSMLAKKDTLLQINYSI